MSLDYDVRAYLDKALTIAAAVADAYVAKLDREAVPSSILPGEYAASTEPSADDIVPGTIRTLPDGMKITQAAVSTDPGNVLSTGIDGGCYLSGDVLSVVVESRRWATGAVPAPRGTYAEPASPSAPTPPTA